MIFWQCRGFEPPRLIYNSLNHRATTSSLITCIATTTCIDSVTATVALNQCELDAWFCGGCVTVLGSEKPRHLTMLGPSSQTLNFQLSCIQNQASVLCYVLFYAMSDITVLYCKYVYCKHLTYPSQTRWTSQSGFCPYKNSTVSRLYSRFWRTVSRRHSQSYSGVARAGVRVPVSRFEKCVILLLCWGQDSVQVTERWKRVFVTYTHFLRSVKRSWISHIY